jgi:hypothetical protein
MFSLIDHLVKEDAIMSEHVIGSSNVSAAVPAVPTVKVLPFDYIPIAPSPTSSQAGMTGYNINWPGPPRRKLNWADVRYYKPQVILDKAAPCDINLYFTLIDDGPLWFETDLCSFTIIFRQGHTRPMDQDIVCPSTRVGGEPPVGAPSVSTGAFWLGCTIKGKIKGNDHKNGRTAHAYLHLNHMIPQSNVNVNIDFEKDDSPKHTIRSL